MENLRIHLRKKPIAASVGVLLAMFAGHRLISVVFNLLPDTLLFHAMREAAAILMVLGLTAACGYGWVYRQRGLGRTLCVMLPYILLILPFSILTLIAASGTPEIAWLPLPNILYGLLTVFGIGFREESIFRGVIVNLLSEKGLRTRRDIFVTVLLSGCLFGAIHLINVFAGATLSSAVFQSLSAAAAGWLLCASYLRGGSIWGLIAVHVLQDATSMFEHLFTEGVSSADSINAIGPDALFIAAIFTLITLFLLRKSGCKKIIERHAKEFPA